MFKEIIKNIPKGNPWRVTYDGECDLITKQMYQTEKFNKEAENSMN